MEFVDESCRHLYVALSLIHVLRIDVTRRDFSLLQDRDVASRVNLAFQSTRGKNARASATREIQ